MDSGALARMLKQGLVLLSLLMSWPMNATPEITCGYSAGICHFIAEVVAIVGLLLYYAKAVVDPTSMGRGICRTANISQSTDCAPVAGDLNDSSTLDAHAREEKLDVAKGCHGPDIAPATCQTYVDAAGSLACLVGENDETCCYHWPSWSTDFLSFSATSPLVYMLHEADWTGEEQDYVRSLMALPPEEREQLMRSEAERLRTYGSALWPIRDIMQPEELAAAGFYYTGVHDRVQCAFCRGVLRNWERGDSAMNEHRVHFSYCRLVMGLDCGNVAITQSQSANLATNGQPYRGSTSLFAVAHGRTGAGGYYSGALAPTTVDGVNFVSSSGLGEPLPGVSTSRPKHPEYAVEARRLQTFSSWPLWAQQSPENLVKAGFFYAGFGDNVKCFYCGGGLRNWETMDSPWEEHARWFQKCYYLLSVNGQGFINEVLKKAACESISDPSQASLIALTGQPRSANESDSLSQAGTDGTVPTLFEQRSVQLVQRLGYSEEQIHAALEASYPGCSTMTSLISAAALLQSIMLMNEQATSLAADLKNSTKSLAADVRNTSNRTTPLTEAVATAATAAAGASTACPELQDSGLYSAEPLKNVSVTTGVTIVPGSSAAKRSAISSSSGPQPVTSLRSLQDIVLTGLVDMPEGEGRLKEENRLIRQHLECKNCRQRQAEMVLLPCGHFGSCLECVPTLRSCPTCSTVVRGTIRTYIC